MARSALALIALVTLAGCATPPPTEQVVQTAIAQTAAAARPTPANAETLVAVMNEGLTEPIAVTMVATAAPVWRDRVSGVWVDNAPPYAEWTIDLDGGEIRAVVNGMATPDDAIRIAFEREEGKTVFVRFTGRPGGDSVDSFRFLDEDTVIWQNQSGERTLRRKP